MSCDHAAGKYRLAKRLGSKTPDKFRRAVRGVDRTEQAKFSLGKYVVKDVLGQGRKSISLIENARTMAHGVNSEPAERDFLHAPINRMVLDPLLVSSISVARMEDGRTGFREIVELVARELSEFDEMRIDAGQERGAGVQRQNCPKMRVGLIVIQAAASRREGFGAPVCCFPTVRSDLWHHRWASLV